MKMKQLSYALACTMLFLWQSVSTKAKAIEACDGYCCDGLCFDERPMPKWWVTADALLLYRTQNNNTTIVVDEDNSLAPVITGDDFVLGMAAGPRLATGLQWESGSSAELVYFGMNQWTSQVSATGSNNLSIPGDLGLATFDFFAADQMDVSYGSEIHNVEFNLWSPHAGLEWMAGFRHFSVNEDFKIASFDVDTFKSDYRISTENLLFGGQIGARKSWSQEWLTFTTEAKIGLFGNANDQHSLVRDVDNNNVLRDGDASSSSLSSLSELRLLGDIALTRNLSLTAGYNLIWLTDVALAPYQLDFTYTTLSSQFVDDTHSVFYHGAIVGLCWVR